MEKEGAVSGEEMADVNVTEISLYREEIDELIEKLRELKNTRDKIEFEIDDENDLIVNYENGEENN